MAIKVSQRYIDSIYKPVVINKKSNKFFEQAQGEFIQNGSKTQQELLSDNSYVDESGTQIRKTNMNNNKQLLYGRKEVSEYLQKHFENDGIPKSEDNLHITLDWFTGININTQPRSYQREKVATYTWKCNLMKTVLLNKHYKIPPIHIRIIRNDNGEISSFEIVDGQQRVTSLLDFISSDINKKFKLNNDFLKMSDKYYDDLNEQQKQSILDYPISVTFYDNITDEQVSELFVYVLNNTNDLKPQEKRNAIRSRLSEFVRESVRDEKKFHKLFARYTVNAKTDAEKTYWVNFSKKFKLGRMEGDEWLAELIYLYLNGAKRGVSQSDLTTMYESTATEISAPQGWNWKTKLQKPDNPKLEEELNELLDFSYDLLQAGKKYQHKFNRVFTLCMILYAQQKKEDYNAGPLDMSKFVKRYMAVAEHYEKFDNYKEKVQADDETPLGPFSKLFGGKNANVFKTVFNLLDEEMEKDENQEFDWGIIARDTKRKYSNSMIEKRLIDNGGIDDYTGEPLSIDDAVGDHNIPWSWGKRRGGETTEENLRVTTKYHNEQKSSMDGEAYKRKLKEEIVA